MSDLRPVRTATSVGPPTPKLTSSPAPADTFLALSAPTSIVTGQAAPQSVLENKRSLALAIKTAWSSTNLWQFLKFGLAAVILNFLPLLVLLLHRPDLEIQPFGTFGARLSSLAVTAVAAFIALRFVGYILTTILQNTVIYGSAKRADNRTANPHNWQSAGVSSFWPVFVVDAFLLVSAVVVGTAALGAISFVHHFVVDQFFMIIAQRVVIGLAAYAAIALLLIRQLAVNSTVIGGFSAFKSLSLSFNIWRRQSSWLFGAGTCLAALGLLATALYAGLVYGFSLGLSSLHFSLPRLTLPIAASLLGWIWLSLWFCFCWIFWQAIYRQAVKHSHPANETRLLGGRSADKPNRYQLATIWLTVLVLLSSATYLTVAVTK